MATNKGVRGEPAAPSGFRAPQFMFDVECEACGASGPKAKRGHYCVDSEGVPTLEFHALRVSAFEARRERKEEPKREARSFRQCAGVPGFPDSCEQEAMGASELCGDCQAWLNEPNRDLSSLDSRIAEAQPSPPPHPWSDEANWYWSGT